MNKLQQTYIDKPGRVDFDKESFDKLVIQKGREVVYERALQCPCKSPSTNQLSNCKNCGGTGWIWVNAKKTRMVLSGIDVVTKYEPWSEEARGNVAITCLSEEKISYMDKIVVQDGMSVFNEVLSLKVVSGIIFAYTAYDIKAVEFLGVFISAVQKLVKLTPEQFSFSRNILRINAGVVDNPSTAIITLRYQHRPTFLIIEFGHETRQSFKFDGAERTQQFPISAYGRRLHYQLKATNLSDDWLISNDYSEGCCEDQVQLISCQIQPTNSTFDFFLVQGDTFDQTISIYESGAVVDITDRTYVMQVRDSADVLLTEFNIGNAGVILIAPNIIKLNKTSVQTNTFPVGLYKYDLQETNGSIVTTFLSGKFIVTEQITV